MQHLVVDDSATTTLSVIHTMSPLGGGSSNNSSIEKLGRQERLRSYSRLQKQRSETKKRPEETKVGLAVPFLRRNTCPPCPLIRRPSVSADHLSPNSAFDLDDDRPHLLRTCYSSARECCPSPTWSTAWDVVHLATCSLLLTILSYFLASGPHVRIRSAIIITIAALALDLVLDFAALARPRRRHWYVLTGRSVCGMHYLLMLVVGLATGGLFPSDYSYWRLGARSGTIMVDVLLGALAALNVTRIIIHLRLKQRSRSTTTSDAAWTRRGADIETGLARARARSLPAAKARSAVPAVLGSHARPRRHTELMPARASFYYGTAI